MKVLKRKANQIPIFVYILSFHYYIKLIRKYYDIKEETANQIPIFNSILSYYHYTKLKR